MISSIADANIFLRLFVAEDKKSYKKSERLLMDAKKGKIKLIVPQIIIFEINYTLSKYYGFEKNRVAEALSSIVNNGFLDIESRNIFLEAIKMYKKINLDLTDCFLIEKAKIESLNIESFDKKLLKNAK